MKKIFLFLISLPITAQITVNLTVSGPRNSANAAIKVNPSTIVAITCPTEVYEGESVICTVSLSRAAPPGGLTVPITGPPTINFPATVIIPAGTTTGRLEFTAPPVPLAFFGKRQQIWAHQQRRAPLLERFVELSPIYW